MVNPSKLKDESIFPFELFCITVLLDNSREGHDVTLDKQRDEMESRWESFRQRRARTNTNTARTIGLIASQLMHS